MLYISSSRGKGSEELFEELGLAIGGARSVVSTAAVDILKNPVSRSGLWRPGNRGEGTRKVNR